MLINERQGIMMKNDSGIGAGAPQERRKAAVQRAVAFPAAVLVVVSGLAFSAPSAHAADPNRAEMFSVDRLAASAEEPKDAPETLAWLMPGERVRIETKDTRTINGHVAEVRDGRVFLTGREDGEGIPLDSIETMWTRRGRETRRGAIAGGAVGAAAGGAILGVLVWGLCDVDSCRTEIPSGVVIGAIGGGAVGALTGSILGSATPHLEQVYSAESGSASALAPAMVPAVPARFRQSVTANPLGLLVHYGNVQYEIGVGRSNSVLGGAYLWPGREVNTGGDLSGGGVGLGYRRYLSRRQDLAGPFAQVSGQLAAMTHSLGYPDYRDEEAVVGVAGPMVGYKWIRRSGLTGELGAGLQWGIGKVGCYEFNKLQAQLTGAVGYSW